MKELIKNLEELNRKAEKGGGDARIEKQHSVGKLTARERQAPGLCLCTGFYRVRRSPFRNTCQENLQGDGYGDANGGTYHRTE